MAVPLILETIQYRDDMINVYTNRLLYIFLWYLVPFLWRDSKATSLVTSSNLTNLYSQTYLFLPWSITRLSPPVFSIFLSVCLYTFSRPLRKRFGCPLAQSCCCQSPRKAILVLLVPKFGSMCVSIYYLCMFVLPILAIPFDYFKTFLFVNEYVNEPTSHPLK